MESTAAESTTSSPFDTIVASSLEVLQATVQGAIALSWWWLLILPVLLVVYFIINAIYTAWERKQPNYPIPKTEERHWRAASEKMLPVAELSGLVYSDKLNSPDRNHDFQDHLEQPGRWYLLKQRPFCHVLARRKDGYAVVVFRGTRMASLRDWATNLEGWFSEFTLPDSNDETRTVSCRVHSGFARRLNARVVGHDKRAFAALLAIIQRMDEELGETLPIYLAGHSLGGALAVLAAARLVATDPQLWKKRIKGVVTFGQPGISDHPFRKHYPLHANTHRLCVGIDIVTFVPPFISYRHVGHQYWLHNDDRHMNTSWMKRIGQGFVVSLKQVSFQGWLDDHSIQKYIRVLEPLLSESKRGHAKGRDAPLSEKPA